MVRSTVMNVVLLSGPMVPRRRLRGTELMATVTTDPEHL